MDVFRLNDIFTVDFSAIAFGLSNFIFLKDSMNKPLEELNIIQCPVCNVTGFVKNAKCYNCKGMGEFLSFQGKVLYWGKRLNHNQILKSKAQRMTKNIINFLLYVFCLIGIIAGILFFLEIPRQSLSTLYFLQYQGGMAAIFWTSLLFDFFIFYRLEKEIIGRKIIAAPHYKKNTEEERVFTHWDEVVKIKKRNRLNIASFFSFRALTTMENAYLLAEKLGHRKVSPVHLFASLLSLEKIKIIFGRIGVDSRDLREKIDHLLVFEETIIDEPEPSEIFKKIPFLAYVEAEKAHQSSIEEEELLLAVIRSSGYSSKEEKTDLSYGTRAESIMEILYDFNVDLDKIFNVVEWLRIQEKIRKKWSKFRRSALLRPKGIMDKAMTAIATPYLDNFSQDLTQLARAGYLEFCVARDQEIDEILSVFESGGQGVMMVGNPGIGMSAILGGIAALMMEDDVPKTLRDKRLVSLSAAKLLSGVSVQKASERLFIIINEILRAGNIVLYISGISSFVNLSLKNKEGINLVDILFQALNHGYFHCLADINPVDYSRYIENSSLANAMNKVNIQEVSKNAAIQILESKVGSIEFRNKVYFSYDAIESAVDLATRYIHDRFLPTKALGIIEEAAILARKERGKNTIVSAEDVARVISKKVNVPLTTVTEEESEKLLALEAKIHERIVGQDEAVDKVADSMRRARVNLKDKKRPIASFLFLGPTGVGKTELAKALAQVYFGQEENMIRVDMSEYQEQTSVAKMIGFSHGVGEEGTGGYLTEAVRANPFSLILLDEIEKALKDILNLFLQVLEDGIITDGLGRKIDFSNTIIIATSNAGTAYIQNKVREGEDTEKIKEYLINEGLKDYFRPEFLNRFDGVIVFKPLTITEVIEIAKIMVNKVKEQMDENGVGVEITDDTISELAQAGFDPVFGARPLRRVIQERVENVLATYLLKNKLARRDMIILDRGGNIQIKKAQ